MVAFNLTRQQQFDNYLRATDFVLIYQMGKVGSSSIEASLANCNIPHWHIHTFDKNEEFQIYRNKKDVACFFNWPTRMAYNLLLMHRKRILQQKKHLKIITLVRDPIATITSRFFQDLHIHFIEGKKNLAIHQNMDATLKHIYHAFDTLIHREYFTHWFDRELKRQFDIDIFEHIKDQNQNHWHIQQNGRDVLLMKCEAINQSTETLRSFLHCDDFTLILSNEANDKWYSSIYQRFKQIYPFEKLFYLYQEPLYKAIYSDHEINQFKQKWQQK